MQSCQATYSALEYGGVFYEETNIMGETPQDILIGVYGGSEVKSITDCFIHVEGKGSMKQRLTFSGNTAGKGGDVVFGGSVASGWDGDVNCLEIIYQIWKVRILHPSSPELHHVSVCAMLHGRIAQ